MQFKKVLGILIPALLLLQLSAFGLSKPRIAIVDFNPAVVMDKISSDLVKTGRFDVLERAQIDKVIEEQNFHANLTQEATYDLQKLGKLLDAQVIITGSCQYGERKITRRGGGSTFHPAQLFLGILCPPLFFIPMGTAPDTVIDETTVSVAVKAVDVGSGRIVSSADIMETDMSRLNSLATSLYCDLLRAYPIYGSIDDILDNKILISLGSDVGLKSGDVLEYYLPGRKIEKNGKELMSLPSEKAGEVKVISVSENSSIAEVIPHLSFTQPQKNYQVQLLPVEALSAAEAARRLPSPPTTDMTNPANLALVNKTEVKLGWQANYSSSAVKVPHTSEIFGGKGFYSNYPDNPLYPSEFVFIMPLKEQGLGVRLAVDNLHLGQDGRYSYDDGQVELGFSMARATSDRMSTGLGFTIRDRWIGTHSIVNGVDNVYEYRGKTVGLNAGLLVIPTDQVQVSGRLEANTGSTTNTGLEIKGDSSASIGLSYKPIDPLTLNLEVVAHFEPSWYDSRIGAEYRLNRNLSLKAGARNELNRIPNFANDANYPKNYDIRRNVYTGGIGYTMDNFYVDLSVAGQFLKDSDIPIFPDPTPGSDKRLLLTSFKDASVKLTIGGRF